MATTRTPQVFTRRMPPPTIQPSSLRPGIDVLTVFGHTHPVRHGTKCIYLGLASESVVRVAALPSLDVIEIPIDGLAELDLLISDVDFFRFSVGYHDIIDAHDQWGPMRHSTRDRGQVPTPYSRGAMKAFQDIEKGLHTRTPWGYHAFNEAMRQLAAERPGEHYAIPPNVGQPGYDEILASVSTIITPPPVITPAPGSGMVNRQSSFVNPEFLVRSSSSVVAQEGL